MDGGNRRLLGLIRDHRGALEYDWRSRFGLGLESIGTVMTWSEATRLSGLLLADPSSWVCASVAGWDHPISREAIVLADMWDLTAKVHSQRRSKQATYPRPWSGRGQGRRHGSTGGRTRDEILAILGRG